MLTRSFVPKSLSWERSQKCFLLRHLEVFTVALSFLGYLFWDNLTRDFSAKTRHKRAKWLVDKFLYLGPTFIKIGQTLSTRVDLLPLEYTQEFSYLQDKVPPIDSAMAIATIETELGKSISDLFATFEPQPLASASIGQVHRARLYTGEEVVVKVQRLGLEKLFNLDFEAVRQLIKFLEIFPVIKKFNFRAINREFFNILSQEINYINEGNNAERFRKNFVNYPHVKVPQVYWNYTTKKVLTLEYLPGIKIDDRETLQAKGISLDHIIQLGICAYLKQLLQDGFFQSDPHPGNMAVDLQGELIFYDFGTMAEVKSVNKDQMVKTFFAVLKKDVDQVLETLMYMGLIERSPNIYPVKRIIKFLLDNFRDKPVDVREFKKISEEIYIMFKEQPFRLPAEMTFIIKSITTLDGIARSLDPQYNLLAASQPFVKSLAVTDEPKTLISNLAKQTLGLIKSQWNRPSKTEILIQELEEKITQGELKFRVQSLESERLLRKIILGMKSLIYACLMGFTLVSAILLLINNYKMPAFFLFGLVGLLGLLCLQNFLKLLLSP